MGSKMLRKARGMPTFEEERRTKSNEFSSDALRKMGFNPFTGRDVTVPQEMSGKIKENDVQKKKGIYLKEYSEDKIHLSKFEERMLDKLRKKKAAELDTKVCVEVVKNLFDNIVNEAVS